MAKKKTIAFDAAAYLQDTDSQIELLTDAFATGEQAYIANAIGIVARARGMTEIAKQTGVTREGLYKAFSPNGDPQLSTLLGAIKALGLKLTVTT